MEQRNENAEESLLNDIARRIQKKRDEDLGMMGGGEVDLHIRDRIANPFSIYRDECSDEEEIPPQNLIK